MHYVNFREIYDYEELRSDWFSWNEKHSGVRVVLFSKMTIPPMFFSVLSVKFTGRAKFGMINTNSDPGRTILHKLRFDKLPHYMIVTPEGNFTFGSQQGEYLNYHSMALYLKTMYPEVNDLFLISLVLINIACWYVTVFSINTINYVYLIII